MNQKAIANITLQTAPVVLGMLLTYLFWRNSIFLTMIYVVAISVILKIKYYPGDLFALAYGFLLGLIVEIIGTSVARYQSFARPDILGMPLWLPIVWAYGLMVMKRIGVIIYEDRVSDKIAVAGARKKKQ